MYGDQQQQVKVGGEMPQQQGNQDYGNQGNQGYGQQLPLDYNQQQPYAYGQPQYGQPQYGQPQYDQTQYGQSQYGQQQQQIQPFGQQYQTQPKQPQQLMMGQPMAQNTYSGNLLPSHANNCPFSTRIKCPNCQNETVTNVQTSPGGGTWLWCVVLAICFWPAMCIPFCIDDCKDKVHSCPRCQAKVGIKEYKPCG